jgi:hypothetical protein
MSPNAYLIAGLLQGAAGLGTVWVVYQLLATSVLSAALLLFLIVAQAYITVHGRYIFVRTADDPFLVGRQLAFLVFPGLANLLLICLWYLTRNWNVAAPISLILGYVVAKLSHVSLFAHEYQNRRQAGLRSLQSPNPSNRRRGVDEAAALARAKVPNAFEALDRASFDSDPDVAEAARYQIRELGSAARLTPIPDQARLDALKRRLLSTDRREQQLSAIELRRLGDPWLYQAGIQLRVDVREKSLQTRLQAITALGYLGDRMAIEYLQLRLADDDPTIREAAQEALDRIQSGAEPDAPVVVWRQ